jgi:hypothetical protein
MSRTVADQIMRHTRGRLPFGTDLVSKGWEQVHLNRVDAAPFSFVGCQISHHWRRWKEDDALHVTLWRRQPMGFAVEFSVFGNGALHDDAVCVDSLAEAMIFLEDLCAVPLPLSEVSGPLCDALLQIQKVVTFGQAFAFLVGEALSDWTHIDHSYGQNTLPQRVTA